MKIKELKKLIQDLPDNMLVVLSSDPEGNGYSVATGFSNGYKYEGGDIGIAKLTPEFEKAGYSEEDVMKRGKPCFVLWP